jgi:hypothetical protein
MGLEGKAGGHYNCQQAFSDVDMKCLISHGVCFFVRFNLIVGGRN